MFPISFHFEFTAPSVQQNIPISQTSHAHLFPQEHVDQKCPSSLASSLSSIYRECCRKCLLQKDHQYAASVLILSELFGLCCYNRKRVCASVPIYNLRNLCAACDDPFWDTMDLCSTGLWVTASELLLSTLSDALWGLGYQHCAFLCHMLSLLGGFPNSFSAPNSDNCIRNRSVLYRPTCCPSSQRRELTKQIFYVYRWKCSANQRHNI